MNELNLGGTSSDRYFLRFHKFKKKEAYKFE